MVSVQADCGLEAAGWETYRAVYMHGFCQSVIITGPVIIISLSVVIHIIFHCLIVDTVNCALCFFLV